MSTIDILGLKQKGTELLSLLQLDKKRAEKANLDQQLLDPDLWNDPGRAAEIGRKISRIEQTLTMETKFWDLIENLEISLEIEDVESTARLEAELQNFLEVLSDENYFNGKFDDEDCFLSIHSGAGGVDAQSFAAMLVSMYQSFCKNMQLEANTVQISLNPEGGVKSCTLEIRGSHAYGLLKEEAGVHRLVRISPFNSGATRETSFALVEVLPASVESSEIKIEVSEKDLRWETSTSQGAGGQSVNTTYSAIRLIHEPTGITVSCQNERSQVQNRMQALKILQARLLALELQKRKDLKEDLKGEVKSAEWGSQIRSYVLHPYKLVKDHRSQFESVSPESVLERGEILPFILAMKKLKTKI